MRPKAKSTGSIAAALAVCRPLLLYPQLQTCRCTAANVVVGQQATFEVDETSCSGLPDAQLFDRQSRKLRRVMDTATLMQFFLP
ncbi:hypothetical protein ACVIU4_008232 [Bradyrhizobium barranii subsp. barranii]|nr:hypothetical protein [Bradyrhizobium japonicum]MCP1960420.1 hypothetical protein [Bradyrhizobium japonicum]